MVPERQLVGRVHQPQRLARHPALPGVNDVTKQVQVVFDGHDAAFKPRRNAKRRRAPVLDVVAFANEGLRVEVPWVSDEAEKMHAGKTDGHTSTSAVGGHRMRARGTHSSHTSESHCG